MLNIWVLSFSDCGVFDVGVSPFPTSGQEAMGGQQQLRRNLHLGFALVFKSREVSLVFIGRHLFPGSVIS